MTYLVAERFKSVQGEGVYAGTPMAFIRFVGCSVGKKVCNACDTAFEQMFPWQGGGEYEPKELHEWTRPYEHICLTGGEPFDQHLTPFMRRLDPKVEMVHIESSGTVQVDLLTAFDFPRNRVWLCVSPKPGFLPTMIEQADEVKVIVPGLGNGDGWPTLQDALRWANTGKTVFLQPRNGREEVNVTNLALCADLVGTYPQLRLSAQLHKLLRVR